VTGPGTRLESEREPVDRVGARADSDGVEPTDADAVVRLYGVRRSSYSIPPER
jgi:hypothetical protein